MSRERTPRRIAILAYPGVQSLDVTGPLEVFAGAAAPDRKQGARGASLRPSRS